MRFLGTTAAVLLMALLALLLVIYVFGSRAAQTDRKPHCSSRQALALVKRELLGRAVALRGSRDTAFERVGTYSVVRAASRFLREHHRGTDRVTCNGSISVDLPPGVTDLDGRRTLTSKVSYMLEPGPGGMPRLVKLGKADAIVLPLATIEFATQSGEAAHRPQDAPNQEAAPAVAHTPATAHGNQVVPSPPISPRPVRPSQSAKVSKNQRISPTDQEPTPQSAPVLPEPRAATARPVAPSPARPRSATAARPSFNCRYARTRGEIAVCNNPGLATLDQQMAGQFQAARTVARPGQRKMLERTRARFLRYRDSCRSESCIETAYRARIREISGIMEGPW